MFVTGNINKYSDGSAYTPRYRDSSRIAGWMRVILLHICIVLLLFTRNTAALTAPIIGTRSKGVISRFRRTSTISHVQTTPLLSSLVSSGLVRTDSHEQSYIKNGLTSEDVLLQRAKYGSNVISSAPPRGILASVASQFEERLVQVGIITD